MQVREDGAEESKRGSDEDKHEAKEVKEVSRQSAL